MSGQGSGGGPIIIIHHGSDLAATDIQVSDLQNMVNGLADGDLKTSLQNFINGLSSS